VSKQRPIINDIGTTEAEIMECYKGPLWTVNYTCSDCPEHNQCEYYKLFLED